MFKKVIIDWSGLQLVFLNDFVFSLRYSFIGFIAFCFLVGYSYASLGFFANFAHVPSDEEIGLLFAGSVALTVALHEVGHGIAYLASNIQWKSITFGFVSRVTGDWGSGIIPSKTVRIFVTLAGPLLPSIIAFLIFSLFGSFALNFSSVFLAVAIVDGLGNLVPLGKSDGNSIIRTIFESPHVKTS